MLNIFAAVTLAVLYSVIVPLENAWGCYSNMDIAGLKYGTCPEFGSVAVVNVGACCVSARVACSRHAGGGYGDGLLQTRTVHD